MKNALPPPRKKDVYTGKMQFIYLGRDQGYRVKTKELSSGKWRQLWIEPEKIKEVLIDSKIPNYEFWLDYLYNFGKIVVDFDLHTVTRV